MLREREEFWESLREVEWRDGRKRQSKAEERGRGRLKEKLKKKERKGKEEK
jgi:hypothetical protein